MSRRDEWEPTRLKYIADCNVRAIAEDADPDLRFTYVDIGNVSQGRMNVESESIRFADAPSRARRIAVPGDTVVSTVRTYLRAVATVPDTEQPLVFSTGFAVLHPRPSVDPGFLAFYLQGDEFVDRVVASSTGVSYPAITATDLVRLDVRLPALAEQRAITAYLDRETAKVDALIAEQQGLVNVLSERRDAVVFHAVTKGLDARSPLVDSGADWLGLVPAHWTVATLRRVGRFVTGTTPSEASGSSFDAHGAVGWARPEDLQRRVVPTKRLSEVGQSQVRVVRDAVLICGIGATVGKVGFAEGRCSSNQQVTALITSQCGLFWYYALLSARAELVSLSTGNTLPILNNERMAQLVVAIPPIKEQQQIAEYLEGETAEIDALIVEAEGVVAVAKKRRSALITAAVTGQIDVRGKVS